MRVWSLALIATAAVAVAGAAAAHARLVSATPAPDSVVASPRAVSMTFSGRMVPAFSGFDLVGPGGAEVAVAASVSDDGKTLSGAPARPLAPGVWRVNWRIASTDGHRMTGSYSFTVRPG